MTRGGNAVSEDVEALRSQLLALARQALHTLQLQQKHYRSRSPVSLQEARDAERRLERAYKDVLQPPEPGLPFGEGTP